MRTQKGKNGALVGWGIYRGNGKIRFFTRFVWVRILCKSSSLSWKNSIIISIKNLDSLQQNYFLMQNGQFRDLRNSPLCLANVVITRLRCTVDNVAITYTGRSYHN